LPKICQEREKMKSKLLLKELKKAITKLVGRNCKDFNFFCYVCQVWMAYQIIENIFELNEDLLDKGKR